MAIDGKITDLTRGVYRRVYAGATTGERINKASDAAEVLFWRLHMIADDFGNFPAKPSLIKSYALPEKDIWNKARISKHLTELDNITNTAGGKLISLYSVGSDNYGHIVGFEITQPAGRNGKRVMRYPGESGCIQIHPDSSGLCSSHLRPDTDTDTESDTESDYHSDTHSDTDTEYQDQDSDSSKKYLNSNSGSASASREPSRQKWLLAVSRMWSLETKQKNADHTSCERLFEDVIWPEGCRDGPSRYNRAMALIPMAGRNGKNKMAYYTGRLRKELKGATL